MNTTENNKLIAVFMELKEFTYYEYLYNEQIYLKDDLYYHSDWNWLMEVVEKIESLGYNVNIFGNCKVPIIKNSNFTSIVITAKKVFSNYNEKKKNQSTTLVLSSSNGLIPLNRNKWKFGKK